MTVSFQSTVNQVTACFSSVSLLLRFFGGNMGGKVTVPPAKFKEKAGVPMNMFGPRQCIANLSWMDDQSDMYIPGASKIPQCWDHVILSRKSVVPTANRKWQKKKKKV